MSGWGDVIAASVGGAAAGGTHAMEFAANDEHKRQLEELKAMIAQISEEGRNRRADQSDTTKNRGIDVTKEQRDADRAARTDAVSKGMDFRYTKLAQDADLAGTRDETTRRGQDLNDAWHGAADDRFWGGTMPLGWANNATSRENNQRTTSTSRANALTAAATSTGNAATAAGTSDKNRRARNVLDVLKMRQKSDSSLLGGDETDWANEFDTLYNNPDRTASEALQGGGAAPDARQPAAVPVGPTGAAAPAPVTLPPGLVVGATVTLKSGQKVKVTKVNPDGTFEHTPIP